MNGHEQCQHINLEPRQEELALLVVVEGEQSRREGRLSEKVCPTLNISALLFLIVQ